MIRRLAAAVVAVGLLTAPAVTADAHSRTVRVLATFATPTTDGLSKVTGQLVVKQTGANNPVTVVGKVAGLAPYGLYVAVPYKDPACTPLPGITAFPSGTFFTDSTGSANVWVTVNPKSINPLGQFSAADTKSVSIRRVIIQGQPLPPGTPTLPPLPGGVVIPTGTPTVPNVIAVEACDKAPRRI